MQINWKTVSKVLAVVIVIDEALASYHATRANFYKREAQLQAEKKVQAAELSLYLIDKMEQAGTPFDEFDTIAVHEILTK